jgi:DNA-binding CsgD family transcriptional regulator
MPLDAVAKSHLFDALVGTLDNIAIGIVIVAEQGRIMHANHAAREMLAAKSPIMALGNCLCALQSERTKELRQAIATAQADPATVNPFGIGVPLIDKSMNPATAHILPLVSPNGQAQPLNMQAPVAVFVTPPSIVPPIETGPVARLFKLTPAEARLLAQLVSGASLAEAAFNLGIAEATARTHRNHVFTKTGVSRRADLIVLVGRLLPPIRQTH